MLDLEGLQLRAALFRSLRLFFHRQKFLEVDTPLRQPVYIPECNIEPIPADGQYLQSSPEQCMKRLLGRGCTKIYQLCPCFRRREVGRLHLEEFYMLEWYRSGADYTVLMNDCEDLFRYLYREMKQLPEATQAGRLPLFGGMDLDRQWTRQTVAEAFSQYSPVSLEQALAEGRFDELLVVHVEPHLGRNVPLFLYDYPAELGSLARIKKNDPQVAERFELYVSGVELANGFSELTDAAEQRLRFQQEIDCLKDRGHGAAMPERFLEDLSGLGSAAGIALGIDRLFMLMMNYSALADAVTFAPVDFL